MLGISLKLKEEFCLDLPAAHVYQHVIMCHAAGGNYPFEIRTCSPVYMMPFKYGEHGSIAWPVCSFLSGRCMEAVQAHFCKQANGP